MKELTIPTFTVTFTEEKLVYEFSSELNDDQQTFLCEILGDEEWDNVDWRDNTTLWVRREVFEEEEK